MFIINIFLCSFYIIVFILYIFLSVFKIAVIYNLKMLNIQLDDFVKIQKIKIN
jgi:hypothetical protein